MTPLRVAMPCLASQFLQHTNITSLAAQPCPPKNIYINLHQIRNPRDLSREQAEGQEDDKIHDGVLVPASRV